MHGPCPLRRPCSAAGAESRPVLVPEARFARLIRVPEQPRYILAPSDMRRLLEAHGDGRCVPTYYDWRETKLRDRILRWLGKSPAPRIAIAPGADLSRVSVLWLGGAAAPDRAELHALLDVLPRLEWIYTQRAGVDHLPVDVIAARGIPLSNGAGLTSVWVAEMAAACVFAHGKQLPAHGELQRRHQSKHLPSRAFDTMRVLAIGTGIISSHTARLLRPAGLRVIGASRRPDAYRGGAFDEVVSLPDALEKTVGEVDAVVLGVPLAADTVGLISASVLARMRSDAALVNLARPRITDERAMVAALRARKLGAAYVSRLDSLNFFERRSAERLPNLHLTHNSEHNVAARVRKTFDQFIDLEKQQRTGAIGNRVI